LRSGASLRARERIVSWRPDGNGIAVRTDRGEHRAQRLVLTAGAWSGPLLAELGVSLRVTRQVVGWVWPRRPEDFELGRFPCWAIQHDAPGFDGIYYGFPLLPAGRFGGERGLKLGHHAPGPTADPDTLDRTAGADDEADFRPALETYLPAAQGATTALRVCMYTMSPDGHFVLDRHPRTDAVSFACGFSGHGFKFSPVIGQALADLALEGRSDLPIGFLGLERLRSTASAEA
jgi:glycine/D-amino acid oxidase-like deaminating enzyme